MSLWIFIAILALLANSANAKDTTIIITKDGPVRGTIHDNGVTTFHGIPFAQPPVGNLRFRAPQPAIPWNLPIDCTAPVSLKMCPQIRLNLWEIVGSEDCLYLNVYLPPNATTSSEPLPVMFWIYGGGYTFGDGYELGLYDGINLAYERNVIIVAPNYRLNAFGFLANEYLADEDPNHSTGNYALLDQRRGMEWTRDNIALFGGNPEAVTIFGESAGGFSVCWHLASPGSRGLFSGAIMESGTCSSNFFFQTIDYATTFSSLYASSFGCNVTHLSKDDFLHCLRSKPADDIMTGLLSWFNPNWPNHINWPFSLGDDLPKARIGASGTLPVLAPVMPWGPVIDGSRYALPDLPLTMIQKGDYAKVPTIMGTNRNEGVVFVPLVPVVDKGVVYPLDEAGFESVLLHFFNETTKDEIIQQYPRSDYKSNDQRASVVLTDFFFVCSTREAVRSISDSNPDIWMYQYDFIPQWIDGRLLGDYHASELYLVWDNQWPVVVHKFDERDKLVADGFNTYWTNMPKHGSPNYSTNNATTAPYWPNYTRQDDLNLSVNVPLKNNTGLVRSNCDFWDTVFAYPSVQQLLDSYYKN